MTSLSKMDRAVHTARTYTYNNSCDKQYILIYNNYSYTATGAAEQNALYCIPKTAFNPQDNHSQRTYQATDLRTKRRRKRQATTFPLRHAHLLGYQQDLECLLVCEGRSDGAVARVQSMALKMAPGNPSASRRLLMKQIFGYKVKFTLRGDTTDLCCACKLAW